MAPVVPLPGSGGAPHRDSLDSSCDGVPFLSNPENAIAVTGMACKFAGADSVEQLWEIFETGSSQCRDLPDDRFPSWRFDRRAYSRDFKAHTIDDIDAFDHKFFKLASREATFMDPQQRLALQVAYQALESSEYFGRSASQRELDIGCYVAACTNEYHENVACHPPSAFSLTGSIRPFIAGKLSHHFGWTGPAIMFDAACAASGVAIHQACRAVATGECCAAVAGGTNLFVSPDTFQDLAAGHFTSPTGASKSFDAAADGYCRGEGVAFVVLKKLSAALKDGDPIRGIIASTAVGQNANETAITVPHGPSQMGLYKKALRLAGLSARDISYVEAHGTGTRVGDPIEVASIRGVFRRSTGHSSGSKTYLGSLKSNIGHTEASSGISGLIKVLLMIQKKVIPQQVQFHNLNPEIDPLEPDGLEIPTSNKSWDSEFKAACVNNYGASGTNAVMIVTQPPCVVPSTERALSTAYPISLTAFSPSSLASFSSVLLKFIGQSSDEDLGVQIAYHLSRRKNFDLPHRTCATISSLQELKDLLRSTTTEQSHMTKRDPRPVVLFFSGQTGRTVSIPRALYDSSMVFRTHLNDCDKALQALGSSSIFPAIFYPETQSGTVLLHSILFSTQYACAMAWLDCGLKPARLIGHSFGQVTAMCVSGILSLRDSLRLVVERARLIEGAWGKDPGSMIAIEAGLEKATTLLERHANLNLEIACYNGPRSFIVAGSTPSADALEQSLEPSSQSLRWKRLPITNAFHSVLAEPLVEPLRDIAQQFTFRDVKIPLELCSEDGAWPSMWPDFVASHVRKPVYFHQAVERIADRFGSCTWLEAGTGTGAPVLRRALEDRVSPHDIKSISLSFDSPSPTKLLAELTSELWRSDHEVQFWPFHQCQRHEYGTLNLPLYQFDKARHWLDWKDTAASEAGVPVQTPVKESILQLVRRNDDEGEFLVNTRCEKWQESCSGNQILRTSVCPVSLLLDTVSQAIDMIGHTEAGKTRIFAVHNLSLQRPIPADSDTELHLKVSNAGGRQSWTWAVSSAPGSDHVYVCGTVSTKDQGSEGEFSRYQRLVGLAEIEDISADAETDSIRGKAVYRSCGDLFQFSESRRKIREISCKGNEAAGYLLPLSYELSAAFESFIQVPLLCLNGLKERRDNELYTTTGIGHAVFRNSFHSSSDTNPPWAIYARFFESDSQETACDIFAFDVQSKKLSAFILDMAFTRVQMESFRQFSGNPITDLPSAPERVPQARRPSEDMMPHTPQTQDLEPESGNSHASSSAGLPDLTKAVFELLGRVADVDPDTIRKDASIADLGIDSLMAIDVTEEINNFFSIKIDLAEAACITDLGSLCEVIASKTVGYSYDAGSDLKTSPATTSTAGSGTQQSTSVTSDTGQVGSTEGSEESYDSSPRSADESTNAVLRAFGDIREDFDVLASRAGCGAFWSQVMPRQEELIVSYVVKAFAKLGCDISLIEEGNEVPKVPHTARNDRLLAELMRILRDSDLVAQTPSGWVRTSKSVTVKPSVTEDFERLLADFPPFTPEHQLLHNVGSELAECLTDKVNPVTLLFGSPERRKLMADQYLIAPIQSAVSQQLSNFIKRCSSLQAIRQPFRVLEIGGGTCGTTLPIVETLTQLEISTEYTFSDISPSFVSAAKSKLAQYKFVRYRTLDITKDPERDTREHFDMIIATNVMHATPDVCTSTRHARHMLRPGGFLALVEYTRRLRLLDLIFGQLDGWWLFDDGRDHAIMDEQQWRATLMRAGFEHADWTRGESRESEILRIFLAF